MLVALFCLINVIISAVIEVDWSICFLVSDIAEWIWLTSNRNFPFSVLLLCVRFSKTWLMIGIGDTAWNPCTYRWGRSCNITWCLKWLHMIWWLSIMWLVVIGWLQIIRVGLVVGCLVLFDVWVTMWRYANRYYWVVIARSVFILFRLKRSRRIWWWVIRWGCSRVCISLFVLFISSCGGLCFIPWYGSFEKFE